METNLRELLVQEEVSLEASAPDPGRLTRTEPTVVFDTRPGKPVLAISDDGESIIAVSAGRKFFPPMVQYRHPDPKRTERAIQDRVAALLEASAVFDREGGMAGLPSVSLDQLEAFFRERMGMAEDDTLRILGSSSDAEELGTLENENTEVFSRLLAGGQVIGIKGRPGAIITTPAGIGMFIGEVTWCVGARFKDLVDNHNVCWPAQELDS